MKLITTVILFALGIAIYFIDRATAQEHEMTHEEGHDLFHHYYQFWYNQMGVHCCEEEHCRPGEFRFVNERWEVLVEGHWRVVEERWKVLDDGGLNPFGSVCHEGHIIYCVDVPEATF